LPIIEENKLDGIRYNSWWLIVFVPVFDGFFFVNGLGMVDIDFFEYLDDFLPEFVGDFFRVVVAHVEVRIEMIIKVRIRMMDINIVMNINIVMVR